MERSATPRPCTQCTKAPASSESLKINLLDAIQKYPAVSSFDVLDIVHRKIAELLLGGKFPVFQFRFCTGANQADRNTHILVIRDHFKIWILLKSFE